MPSRAAPHRGIDTPQDTSGPSKTALKAEAQALQTLGHELSLLDPVRLADADLPDALREALDTLRRTRSHEGRRRQLQYVGKLMRGVDPGPLREVVSAAALGGARDAWRLHEAERWRDALLSDDAALTRWLADHPDCDAQRLRSLVRAGRRDAQDTLDGARRPRSHRELYRFLHPWIAESPP